MDRRLWELAAQELAAHTFARREAILLRIFERCLPVIRIEALGECWEWQGPTSGETGRGAGYGRFSFEGATAATHRTVWAVMHGPIPPRKQIDHKCQNRLCCNPDHLQIVTHRKNQLLKRNRP